MTSVDLVGSTITVDVDFDDIASGFQDGGTGKSPHATITDYRVCIREQSSTAPPPTRDASDGWDCPTSPGPRSVATAPGGSALSGIELNCSDSTNVFYIATRLALDGGSRAVSKRGMSTVMM